jgi:hypothetical protein
MSGATESFNFELRLIDAVIPTAKKEVDALQKVDSAATKAQQSLSKRFAGQWEKIGFAADRSAFKQQQSFAGSWTKIGSSAERAAVKQKTSFADAWSKIGMSAEKTRAKQDRSFDASIRRQLAAVDRAEEKMRERSFGSGVSEGFGVDKFTKAAFFGSLAAEGVMKIGEAFIEGAKTAVEIFTEGVKHAFEEAGKQQTLRIGEKLSLGKGAGEYREDVERFSKLSGFDDDRIRQLLLPLRRGGMNQQAARTAFAAAGDVAAGEGRGSDFGRVSEVLSGFQNIFLKGGINEKKLVNLGVNAPEFYKELAKDLKISGKAGSAKTGEGATTAAEEAKKRAEQGKIDPQVLLNAIYRGIERKQGGQLGTGTIATSQSYQARIERLQNLPNEYLRNLVDSPNFQRASDMMAGLLEKLDPEGPAGQRIMATIESMFDKITSLVGDPADTADKLADHIENAVDFAGQLISDFRDLYDALVPSLDTLEDMVLAFRQMKAYASGNQFDLMAVAIDRAKIDQRRLDRVTEKQVRGYDSKIYADAYKDTERVSESNGYGRLYGDYGPQTKEESKAIAEKARFVADTTENQIRKAGGATQKDLHVHVEAGAVVVQAGEGETTDSVHSRAGKGLFDHIVRAAVGAMEQAAQEGGG